MANDPTTAPADDCGNTPYDEGPFTLATAPEQQGEPLSAKAREAAFRADFAALLAKHGAELEVTDDGKPYGLHNGVAIISMQGIWADGEQTAEYTEFRL